MTVIGPFVPPERKFTRNDFSVDKKDARRALSLVDTNGDGQVSRKEAEKGRKLFELVAKLERSKSGREKLKKSGLLKKFAGIAKDVALMFKRIAKAIRNDEDHNVKNNKFSYRGPNSMFAQIINRGFGDFDALDINDFNPIENTLVEEDEAPAPGATTNGSSGSSSSSTTSSTSTTTTTSGS